MTTIRPSDVCQRIQRDHDASRTKMDQIGRAVGDLRPGKAESLQRVRQLSRLLHDELVEHIDLEREILLPALRDADAWGDARARRLSSRHLVRLRELATLKDACSRGDCALAGDLRAFIDGRSTDMAQAERLLLNSGVLRDDVMGIDVDGG